MAMPSTTVVDCPFSGFSCTSAIDSIQHLCKPHTYRIGETICMRGELAHSLPIILSGELNVKRYSRSGSEIILSLVTEGECCFVSGASLLANSACMADVYAETDTKVLILTRDNFFAALSLSDNFRSYIFRCIELGLSQAADMIESISSVPIEQRLSQLLLQLCDSRHEVKKRHSELAAKLGTAREVVSRTLKHMENKNVVELRRCCVCLRDIDKLKTLAQIS